MTRTFIAIEISTAARDALRREIAQLAQALPGVRFVDPASLHITLAFLGELGEAQLAQALSASAAAAEEAHPLSLRIAGIGTFGAPRAPRVIWAGIAGDVPALRALHAQLAEKLIAQGFPREDRPFAPHLTLARVKSRLEAEEWHALEAHIRATASEAGTPLPVAALAVMKSELLPTGARYTRLHEYRFDDAG